MPWDICVCLDACLCRGQASIEVLGEREPREPLVPPAPPAFSPLSRAHLNDQG